MLSRVASRPLISKGASPCRFAVAAPRTNVVVRVVVEERANAKESDKKEEKQPKKAAYTGPDVVPNIADVESFLATLVHETDIVDVHLEVGNFELRVRRSVAPDAPPPPPAPHAHFDVVFKADAPVKTLAPAPPIAEESVDESLLPVVSPKVGIFRRGRYAGNKRVGKGNCVAENDKVKKGQAIGFVEQLGTFVPVEAPQAGEVIKFDVKDGEAVEYLQTILHIVPFFGGALNAPLLA